jgi:hypothetical protein
VCIQNIITITCFHHPAVSFSDTIHVTDSYRSPEPAFSCGSVTNVGVYGNIQKLHAKHEVLT